MYTQEERKEKKVCKNHPVSGIGSRGVRIVFFVLLFVGDNIGEG